MRIRLSAARRRAGARRAPRSPRREHADDDRVVDAGAGLAVVLRPVERAVGELHQLVAVGRHLRVDGDAGADGDRSSCGKSSRRARVEPLERVVAPRSPSPRQQHRELLAADAEGAVRRRLAPSKSASVRSTSSPTGWPKRSLIALEVVDVEHTSASGCRAPAPPAPPAGRSWNERWLRRPVSAVGLGVARREHRAVGVALVQREREERAGEQQLERRGDLPQRRRQRRDERHDRERRAGVADVVLEHGAHAAALASETAMAISSTFVSTKTRRRRTRASSARSWASPRVGPSQPSRKAGAADRKAESA